MDWLTTSQNDVELLKYATIGAIMNSIFSPTTFCLSQPCTVAKIKVLYIKGFGFLDFYRILGILLLRHLTLGGAINTLPYLTLPYLTLPYLILLLRVPTLVFVHYCKPTLSPTTYLKLYIPSILLAG